MEFNQFFRFIQAIMFAFVSIPMIAQIGVVISPVEYPVSQTEAFTVLKTHFLDREVDYYLMDGYSANEWTFFVDANPNAPWSHTCYVATVPKKKSSIAMSPAVHLTEMTTPPDANFVELEITEHPVKWIDSNLPLSELNSGLFNNQYKNNVYAVILFTDRHFTDKTDYFRNDCCFIYKTLTSKYQIPKDHVFPLMYSFFTGVETTRSYNWYDLDGDGEGEPNFNISSSGYLYEAIDQINRNIHEGDMFFLFIAGAGDFYNGISSIKLSDELVFLNQIYSI